jgi:GNAT superfamily N-acetyltransferase
VLEIRAFDPSADGGSAFGLWTRSLGEDWPVPRDEFDVAMHDGLVAVDGGRVVGIATFSCEADVASLQLVLVDPELQRQGVGAKLHEEVVAELRRRGVTRARLAGTPGHYLWPGLPGELVHLRKPLERRGWTFRETCWDLARSLAAYETPIGVATPAAGVTFRWATAEDRAPLLAFERAYFPQWLDAFSSDEGAETAIVGVGDGGQIVGSLLAADQHRPHLWRNLLGDACGSINCVGVDEREQGRGIGTRMVAYACEQLRASGVINCHIGWAVLLPFYGRLGFEPWRAYERAELELSP